MISGLENYFEALRYLNTLELCNVLCSFLLLRSARVVCIRNETFLEEIFEIIKEKVFVSFIISIEFTRHEGFDKTDQKPTCNGISTINKITKAEICGEYVCREKKSGIFFLLFVS